MSTDWFWPKMPPRFRQIFVKRSVRISSKDSDHTSNSEGAKDIHEICGSLCRKLEANEVGSLPRLSFLNLCLKFGQLFTCLIYFDLSYSTANFSRGNTYPSNFNRFHSIVIPPVNKSPRGPDLPGHWCKIQNLVQPQGFPRDGRVHLADGLASVQTFLKRCQTSIKLTYLMQSRSSVVDIFGIEIRFGNQHFKLAPIHIICFI
jgi:hypothetical protein